MSSSKALREATISGVRWLAVMRVVSETIALGAAAALARLVSPAEFGRAAVALIFIMLGVLLTFEGFASALVQRPEISDEDRGCAMLTSILGGLGLGLVIYLLAGPVWRPLFGSRTAGLIALASVAVPIAALGGVSRAMVWRRLDFRRISMIDALSLLGGSLASVGLAIAGMGAPAIVIGGLVQIGVGTLLLMISAPPPLPRWSAASQRAIAGFGVPAALAALVDTSFRNVDYAIMAARVPAAQAGFYYRAFNVGVVYQDKLSQVMRQIAFPLYSRTTDRAELREMHERAARLHAIVIFPMLAALVVLAPLLVPLVFGPAWKPAVAPTQILAVAGMAAAILTGYPQLMLAIGRPRSLMHFNIGMLIVYAGAVLAASRHGLIVVAATVSCVYLAILVGVYRLLLQKYVGISLRRLVPELAPAVVGCIALLAVTWAVAHLLRPSLPAIVTASVAGATGIIAYGIVIRALFLAAWSDLTKIILRVFPSLSRLRSGRASTAAATPR